MVCLKAGFFFPLVFSLFYKESNIHFEWYLLLRFVTYHMTCDEHWKIQEFLLVSVCHVLSCFGGFFFPSPDNDRPIIKHLLVFVIIIPCHNEKMKICGSHSSKLL